MTKWKKIQVRWSLTMAQSSSPKIKYFNQKSKRSNQVVNVENRDTLSDPPHGYHFNKWPSAESLNCLYLYWGSDYSKYKCIAKEQELPTIWAKNCASDSLSNKLVSYFVPSNLSNNKINQCLIYQNSFSGLNTWLNNRSK